jgi:hypothetical protein
MAILTEMGYEISDVRRVLHQTDGDRNAAVELLMNMEVKNDNNAIKKEEIVGWMNLNERVGSYVPREIWLPDSCDPFNFIVRLELYRLRVDLGNTGSVYSSKFFLTIHTHTL